MADRHAIRERLEAMAGQPTKDWLMPDTGLSAAIRYTVTFEDGSRVFVKAATDDATEQWLRTEYQALQSVPDRFVPRVIAWMDEPDRRPMLVVESLDRAHWPASHQGVDWREGDIDLVLAAVKDLSHVQAPTIFASTPPTDRHWPTLGRPGPDQDAYLALGLCSPTWLDRTAPHLVAAEASVDETGDRMVHGDVRSDNLCIDGDRVVFVDWANASRGNPDHDLANLLPALHLEGGPRPFDVMADGGAWAAAGSAALAHRVVNHQDIPAWLRDVLLRLSAIDLAWAASSLRLPQPDGIDWQSI